MPNLITLIVLLNTNVLFHQSWPLPPCPEPPAFRFATNLPSLPNPWVIPTWPGIIITNLLPMPTNSMIIYTQKVLHAGPGIKATPRTNDGKVEWIIEGEAETEEKRNKREADAEELDRFRRLFPKPNTQVTP